MAERISEADFAEKVNQAEGIVLLDFYSDSCIPCKMLSPILGEIEEEYAGTVAVYKVNVDHQEKLAGDHRIMSSPTLLLFRNGEVLDRKSGVQKKEVLTEWLDKYLHS